MPGPITRKSAMLKYRDFEEFFEKSAAESIFFAQNEPYYKIG